MRCIIVYVATRDLPEAPFILNPFPKCIGIDETAISKTQKWVKPSDDPVQLRLRKQFRKELTEIGLHEQLLATTPILHRRSLEYNHEKLSPAIKNYMANVLRTLYSSQLGYKTAIHQFGTGTTYCVAWSIQEQNLKNIVFLFFFFLSRKLEKLGQTIATSINYMKNLETLFDFAITNYCIEDSCFPKIV